MPTKAGLFPCAGPQKRGGQHPAAALPTLIAKYLAHPCQLSLAFSRVQAPKREAASILQRRFPVPRLVDCDQNGSQVRYHPVIPISLHVLFSETMPGESYKCPCDDMPQ